MPRINFSVGYSTKTSVKKITSEGSGFYAVGGSSSGQYLVASGYNEGIWTSSDYGNTWTKRANAIKGFDAIISPDGRYILITDFWDSGAIYYYSSDYGATWNTRSFNRAGWITSGCAYRIGSPNVWHIAEGIMGGSAGVHFHTSTDYGATWASDIFIPTTSFGYFVSCSGNGQYILVGTGDGYSTAFSTDYGNTFQYILDVYNKIGGSISLDGSKMVVHGTQNAFYSNDYGNSWNPSSGADGPAYGTGRKGDFSAVYYIHSSSPDLYRSTDNGASFYPSLQVTSTGYCCGMFCSDDGNTIVVGTSDGLYKLYGV